MVYFPNTEDPRYEVLSLIGSGNYDKAAEVMVKLGGPDSMIDSDGRSLLHDAVQDSDGTLVRAILRLGAPRSLNSLDEVGKSPLAWAAAMGDVDTVLALVAAGASIELRCEEMDCNTPLIEAVKAGHVDVVAQLLHAGADPDSEGRMGQSARTIAQSMPDEGTSVGVTMALRRLLGCL